MVLWSSPNILAGKFYPDETWPVMNFVKWQQTINKRIPYYFYKVQAVEVARGVGTWYHILYRCSEARLLLYVIVMYVQVSPHLSVPHLQRLPAIFSQ